MVTGFEEKKNTSVGRPSLSHAISHIAREDKKRRRMGTARGRGIMRTNTSRRKGDVEEDDNEEGEGEVQGSGSCSIVVVVAQWWEGEEEQHEEDAL